MSITYDPSSNIITCVGDATKGDSESNPFGFVDLYNADKSGTLILEPSKQYTASELITLNQQVKPADSKTLSIYVQVTQVNTAGGLPYVHLVIGLDGEDDTISGRTIDINAVGEYPIYEEGLITKQLYKSINSAYVYVPAGSSITLYFFQKRWGVVWKSGIQFALDSRIIIGDGTTTTWFIDTLKEIEVLSTVASGSQFIFETKAQATLRFGTLVDATLKTSKDGVKIYTNTPSSVRVLYPTGGTVQLYNSYFSSPYIGLTSIVYLKNTHRVWNCYFDGCALALDGAGAMDAFNIIISKSSGLGITGDRIYIFNVLNAFWVSAYYSHTSKNVLVKQCTNIVSGNPSLSQYLINVESSTWLFSWTGTNTGKVYRQYEFDSHCQDKDGNAISGVSAVGIYTGVAGGGQAFSVTTDANGDIATQTVDHGYFQQATGSTEQLKAPLKVTYSKAGYKTVVKYYPLNEKTKDRVVLQKAVDIIFVDGKKALNLSESDPENELYVGM